jgi:hypothetical protein
MRHALITAITLLTALLLAPLTALYSVHHPL